MDVAAAKKRAREVRAARMTQERERSNQRKALSAAKALVSLGKPEHKPVSWRRVPCNAQTLNVRNHQRTHGLDAKGKTVIVTVKSHCRNQPRATTK